ncbi:MAG: CoA pyrophosphatase [Rhodothermales bacterium]|nr:CoA pyrophosphatase [Rhodothermales bacterium]MBO6780896.1 CoA pyrophosphatase [Rhodothermales bacterium]
MHFPDLLQDRLSQRLPGPDAQLVMSPRGRPRIDDLDNNPCREAGVLALLHASEGGPCVVLIERPGHLKKHAGQVAFPGGRREGEESRRDAALRETWEEIGVRPETIAPLGALTPLFVPPSGFCVYPFVGWIEALPPLRLEPGEVASAFSVPLARFVDGPRELVDMPRLSRQVPAFRHDEYVIWGATAMMLAELAAVAEPVLPRG